MSYCLKCKKHISSEPRDAVDSRGIPIIRVWEPLLTLCSDCYNSGWRLDVCCGDIISLIQVHDELGASLLDLPTNEEDK